MNNYHELIRLNWANLNNLLFEILAPTDIIEVIWEKLYLN